MQGTLRDFRLAEILQLVASQQKTGLLRVHSHEMLLTFYFHQGVLVSCRDRRHLAADPLLDYLRRTGFLEASQALHLRTELESTKNDLAEAVLEKHLLTEDELRTAIDDLAQDLVYRTFSWDEGTYRFVSGEQALQGLRHTIARQVEGLLMEAARRADEWPRLVERLPGPQVLLDAVDALPTWMDARANGLLAQLTTPMRLGELVARARMPEYDVYEFVASAVEADIVRILEKPEPHFRQPVDANARLAAEPTPAWERRAHRPPAAVAWMLAVWASFVCVGGAAVFAPRLPDEQAQAAAAEIATEAARGRVRHLLEVYRALHGGYPASLDELTRADLTTPRVVKRAKIARYVRSWNGDAYRLVLAETRGGDDRRERS
ncbi:MAG: DUF4388 domain-containing protein [Candidatus Krumholzibacteriia bacterium]